MLLAILDRIEPQRRRLRLAAELAQPQAQPLVAGAGADVDPLRDRAPALRGRFVDAVAHLVQADHVGVRVEDHDPQARLQQQLLEDDAERVRLAGAGLAAEERVAVEAAGVERERHTRRQAQLADGQPGAAARAARLPGAHLVARRRPDRRVVERRAVARQHDALAAHRADDQPGPHRGPLAALLPPHLGGVDLLEPLREHLPEPRLAVALEHHVAAGGEREADRGLQLEATPLERGGDREDALLEAAAEGPVLLEVAFDHAATARRSWKPRTTESTPRTTKAIPIRIASVPRLTSGSARISPPSTMSTNAASSR